MPIHVTTSTIQSLSNKTFVDYLSTTGAVYADGGNSEQWNSTFSIVQTNSADWNYQGSDIKALTANWENTYTDFSANSGKYESVYTTTNTNFIFRDGLNNELFVIQGNGDVICDGNLSSTSGSITANTLLEI